MNDVFLSVVNMSISAGWIVLAVLLLRLLIKKAPKWITVLLWGIVAVRLICPFSIESVLSLIPSAETISPEIMMDRTPEINMGVPIINNTINQIIAGSLTPAPEASANPLQIWIPVLASVWVLGMVALLIYTVISYWRIKRKIDTAVLLRDNVYQSENVVSPFVLGIIKPKIYLPFSMNEQDVAHVIAHEQAHIRRKDHWWKPIGFLLLTLHWFNPLMWFGYVLLCRDIETACDEKVVKELDAEQKADYSQALLVCSVNRRIIAACPLAFGEVGVKNRVKSILNYKKPAFWISVAAVAACIIVAICFLTNPPNDVELNNRAFGVEKWYFDYMIGEDRANKENMNWQIRIDHAGAVTFLVEHENTWAERGKLEPISSLSVWEMVKEKLPFYYRHLNVQQAYAALDAESGNATTFFVTKNNLIFQAYIPSYNTEDMYVHELCKIKKIATLVSSGDTGESPDNFETDQTHISVTTTSTLSSSTTPTTTTKTVFSTTISSELPTTTTTTKRMFPPYSKTLTQEDFRTDVILHLDKSVYTTEDEVEIEIENKTGGQIKIDYVYYILKHEKGDEFTVFPSEMGYILITHKLPHNGTWKASVKLPHYLLEANEQYKLAKQIDGKWVVADFSTIAAPKTSATPTTTHSPDLTTATTTSRRANPAN